MHDVSAEFDSYWNHSRSLPIAAIDHKFSEAELASARAALSKTELEEDHRVYEHAVNSELLTALRRGELDFYPAAVNVMSDDPHKLEVPVSKDEWQLFGELDAHLQRATSTILVMTPYFVPGTDGIDYWRSHVDRGVRVVIVTNSLASNNHIPVHSAYSGLSQGPA